MANITGADELIKKLEKLKELQKSIPIAEVLTPEFMKENSKFDSVAGMFEKSGFTAATNEDFEKIPDTELNAFVAENTKFKSWPEMSKAAMEIWLPKEMKKLGF